MTQDDELIAEVWREVRGGQLRILHGLVRDVRSVAGGTGDAETWRRVRDAAHRLAGSLGSFDQEPAGETAVALEEVVGGTDEPDADLVARTVALTTALHAALPHSPEECPLAGS